MNRTLTLDLLDGRRSYEAVAHRVTDGMTGGMVGLRLTGWDRGRVVTELVGEIPAVDALDVGGLLAAALGGFRAPAPAPAPELGPEVGPALALDTGSGTAAVLDGAATSRLEEGTGVRSQTADPGQTRAAVRGRPQMSRAARPGLGPPRPPG
ncbi:hypothetical protein ABT297_38600 [Dactylosporangium sp. NPDC000555]|uniref:hypothetical protein n=1 Tax=Dactylosporangium sp. NPDC000555 TaxID=3154260 RepID=UPI0033175AE6